MDTVANERIERIATEAEPFHFTASGLENVFLVGIKYFEKADGTFVAEIPAIQQLMYVIARSLVFSDSELDGSEIRFLRKRLGCKSSDFAKFLSLDLSTLSRVENEKQASSPQVSKLVKIAYTILCKDPEPSMVEFRQQLATLLLEDMKEHSEHKILVMVSASNEWTGLPQAA